VKLNNYQETGMTTFRVIIGQSSDVSIMLLN